MNFAIWEEDVPEILKKDALWTVKVYRLALFLSDVAWHDVVKLSKAAGMRSLSDQFCRSVGSICANIEEGYSKLSSKDRARFYEYSLGSARETRGWFYRARHVIGEDVAIHRFGLSTEIIKLLLTMVPEQRSQGKQRICEDRLEYVVKGILDTDAPF